MLGPRRGLNGRIGGGIGASTKKPATALSKPVIGRSDSGSDDGDDAAKNGKENGSKKSKKNGKEDKEFAWMDSGDESSAGSPRDKQKRNSSKSKKTKKASEKRKARSRSRSRSRSGSSCSSDAAPTVPIAQIDTLGQMARAATSLQKRLEKGELRPRELVEVVQALARSKYFNGELFSALADELRRAVEARRRDLGVQEILDVVFKLADLNAYNERLFEAACVALTSEMPAVPESERQKLEATLKRFSHRPGDEFIAALRSRRPEASTGSRKPPCELFFRGQCKWGPKCKLSHDEAAFDNAMNSSTWRPPTQSGNKSVGYKQSADLFKADRCGALW
eukprot:TRINITY_DN112896_c0_g1_i1.p1 TRINITY_DN112896_c0_g1~~TRINITY_DN112896_c0_g1_i1.p1  ORF type:complete len:336 (+),score=85.65 TRINITY_DN112896_c0_g1_i1:161-1168(+)